MSHAFPPRSEDIATPARRPSADRLLDALAEAGGGPQRPGDLGAVARVGHTAQAEGLGELRRDGLIEGPIHEVSLTAAGWELARRRQGLGGDDPGPAEPLPAPRGDAPAVPVSAELAPTPAADDASPKDPEAQDPAPVAPRNASDDGASDAWGWLFVITVPAAVILWLRSRGRAAGALRPVLAEDLSAAEGAAPAPASLQVPRPTGVPDYVLQAQRRLDGR